MCEVWPQNCVGSGFFLGGAGGGASAPPLEDFVPPPLEIPPKIVLE